MTRCEGTCLTRKRCKKNAIKDSLCWNHSPESKELIECGICLKDVLKNNKNNERLDCGHIFCKKCIYTWIIEKEETATCPMCRNKIAFFFILNAREWGFSKGLVLEVKITTYPLTELEHSEFLFFASFCRFARPSGLTDEHFHLIHGIIKYNQECNKIFQKLKEKSITQSIFVKKNEYTTHHLHYFVL